MDDKLEFLSHEYIKNLPSNPLEALDTILSEYFKLGSVEIRANYSRTILSLLKLYNKSHPEIIQNITDLNTLDSYLGSKNEIQGFNNTYSSTHDNVISILSIRDAKAEVESKVNDLSELLEFGEVTYSLDDDDRKNIQQLINELRDSISNSEDISEEHKNRLLNQLVELQKEFDKKIPDRIVLYGRIFEFVYFVKAVVKEAEPLVDKSLEILKVLKKPIVINLKLQRAPDIKSILAPKNDDDSEGEEND